MVHYAAVMGRKEGGQFMTGSFSFVTSLPVFFGSFVVVFSLIVTPIHKLLGSMGSMHYYANILGSIYIFYWVLWEVCTILLGSMCVPYIPYIPYIP